MCSGICTWMTSAPQSASWRAAVGPARTWVRSITRKRASAVEAGRWGMAASVGVVVAHLLEVGVARGAQGPAAQGHERGPVLLLERADHLPVLLARLLAVVRRGERAEADGVRLARVLGDGALEHVVVREGKERAVEGEVGPEDLPRVPALDRPVVGALQVDQSRERPGLHGQRHPARGLAFEQLAKRVELLHLAAREAAHQRADVPAPLDEAHAL